MGGYLNEAEAKEDIEEIVSAIENDFKIYLYKRERDHESITCKIVTFILTLAQNKNNEKVFSALMDAEMQEGNLKVFSSVAQLHEGKRMVVDVFTIEIKINRGCQR